MSFTASTVIVLIGIAAVSYMLGSISFAVIFTKIFTGNDVRDFGSKNAGMTNVARVAGKKAAALTFICDVAKGAVAVLLAKVFGTFLIGLLAKSSDITAINPLIFGFFAGFFVIIGHIYPVFFGFHGGKGVAAAFGIMLFIDWRAALIGISGFLIIFLFTRIVSISALSACISVPITTYFLYDESSYTIPVLGMSQRTVCLIFAIIYALVVIFAHRSNIKRLINGTENKMGKNK